MTSAKNASNRGCLIKPMETLTLYGLSEASMEALGHALGQRLFPGAFLAFFGDLGAGKTTLTRALAASLGIDGIASPTFTIVREHEGTLPLFHFDAYRLSDEDELFAIGFDDYFTRGGVIAMEWCENVPGALPNERLELHLKGSGAEHRTLRLEAKGAAYETILDALEDFSK